MDALTSCQFGSQKPSFRPVRVPACAPLVRKTNMEWRNVFFLAYTSVPRHAASGLTIEGTGGKRLL